MIDCILLKYLSINTTGYWQPEQENTLTCSKNTYHNRYKNGIEKQLTEICGECNLPHMCYIFLFSKYIPWLISLLNIMREKQKST